MEHSKLSMRDWFYSVHLISSIRQVLSAKDVQLQLGMPQYPPIELMMMKLRFIMVKRDAIYTLDGEVDIDEAFFPTRVNKQDKRMPLKHGEGIQQQTKVLVIVESKSIDDILKLYLEQ